MIPRPRCGFSAAIPILAIFALSVSTGDLRSQDDDTPERIDLSNFPGEMVDQVVVPIPAEIFIVLDKLGDNNWKDGIDYPAEIGQTRERAILALTFGSLVGEGFIAVQAESAEDIQKIGQGVLSISESLGLADAVGPHSLAIIQAADKRDWEMVRDELDKTQQTVRDTMDKLRDQELSELVSLGGWLRGTNVVTTFISEDFARDKAELLNQPGLLSHFRAILGVLSGPSRNSPQIREISTGLARMEAIITEEGDISEEDIKELRDISRSLLEQFYFEAGSGEEAPAN